MKNSQLGLIIATIFSSILINESKANAISFIPDQLEAGDPYRLIFVTSTRVVGGSTNINFYNNFVTSTANSSGAVGDLMEEAGLCSSSPCKWYAVASTGKGGSHGITNARDNTKTSPYSKSYNTEVPIFLVGNQDTPEGTLTKIADNYSDLWDTRIDAFINHTEFGTQRNAPVWTGTSGGGGPAGNRGIANLGYVKPAVGFTYWNNLYWVSYRWTNYRSNTLLSMYAISEELFVPTAVPEPLTILGTGTAIAFGAGFKRKLAKAKKK